MLVSSTHGDDAMDAFSLQNVSKPLLISENVAKESTLEIPLVQQFQRISPEGIVFAWHTNRNRNTSPETWDQNGSGWWLKKKTERLQQQWFRATTCVVVLSLLGARRVKLCAFSSEDDDDRANDTVGGQCQLSMRPYREEEPFLAVIVDQLIAWSLYTMKEQSGEVKSFGFVVAKESTLEIPLLQQFHRMSPKGILFAWHTNRNRNTSPETWDQNGSGWWSKKKTERLQQQRFRATTWVVVLSLLGARRVKPCAFSSEDDDDRANDTVGGQCQLSMRPYGEEEPFLAVIVDQLIAWSLYTMKEQTGEVNR
ncbi:hypothetical protein DY000_02041326 [Brassica cretica]|uniref:Uncharacterized protein n=1 Tax=Brassica cretica TaxID=69181 RepID=A0ABQ7B5E1_BRACR|nr:hypothetical protein DY000_02041326 [Brassica cretica]